MPASVAALARERNVGLLHITDDVEPNPYDTVPDDAYMQQFMDAVPGSSPPNDGIFLWPKSPGTQIETPTGRFLCDSFDYSSATFTWQTSVGAAGYRIYQDSAAILSLTPTMTTVTVGGLEPGTNYVFGMSAINPDGTDAGISDTVSFTTLSLPGKGHTVSSVSASVSADQTIYRAHILVPYAFVRIFIIDTYDTCFQGDTWVPGWAVTYGGGSYENSCSHWMVEGGTLYRFSGTQAATENAPWSWAWAAEVSIVQSRYDYTWTIPIGSSTTNVDNFFVQLQGYGPMANVFRHCVDGLEKYNHWDNYCT